MKYMMLHRREQKVFLAELEAMPDFLADRFADVPVSGLTTAGPDDTFSPLEHVWHLADLERDGFALRIERLKAGGHPQLPDFDGGAVAEAGNYKARSLDEGIAAFRAARRDNVAALRDLPAAHWLNTGEQEGVGSVTLCDIPAMMAEHDAIHRDEIGRWLSARQQSGQH